MDKLPKRIRAFFRALRMNPDHGTSFPHYSEGMVITRFSELRVAGPGMYIPAHATDDGIKPATYRLPCTTRCEDKERPDRFNIVFPEPVTAVAGQYLCKGAMFAAICKAVSYRSKIYNIYDGTLIMGVDDEPITVDNVRFDVIRFRPTKIPVAAIRFKYAVDSLCMRINLALESAIF